MAPVEIHGGGTIAFFIHGDDDSAVSLLCVCVCMSGCVDRKAEKVREVRGDKQKERERETESCLNLWRR